MTISIALIIFSSIGLVTTMFMVTYFLFIKNDNRLINLSLGILFLAIGLRILKSVIYYVFSEISSIGVGVGFLGFASIGPLLYFYFKISKSSFYLLSLKDVLHFGFAFVGFGIISFLNIYHNEFYLATKFQFAVYLIYIGKNYVFVSEKDKLSKWYAILFYSMVAILLIFIFQFFVGNIESYTIGTAMASLILYILFFVAIKTPSLIKKSSPISLSEGLLDKIKIAIEVDKIYTQPAITLSQFSEAINMPSYLVSKATKVIYNKSFPEVINSFRIKETLVKLSIPEYSNVKVEDLAYDVGFNTSSAFYNAFKKETSISPRAYQKKMQSKNFSN